MNFLWNGSDWAERLALCSGLLRYARIWEKMRASTCQKGKNTTRPRGLVVFW